MLCVGLCLSFVACCLLSLSSFVVVCFFCGLVFWCSVFGAGLCCSLFVVGCWLCVVCCCLLLFVVGGVVVDSCCLLLVVVVW